MTAPTGPSWLDLPAHHRWLTAEADRLLEFHEADLDLGLVGYAPLDAAGVRQSGADRDLYATARIVHCFAIAHLLGRPGARRIADHGMDALLNCFRDAEHGGWVASVTPAGHIADDTKSGYGHAFVLLAAASALQAGLEGAEQLFREVNDYIDASLWVESEGAILDSLTREGAVIEPGYRGQNPNMHLTEAYLAAFEATGAHRFIDRAERISELIVLRNGRVFEWRIPEHFNQDWVADPDFNVNRPQDPFRPYGSLVGHWFEWARLLLQLSTLQGGDSGWFRDAARKLFEAGVHDGWDVEHGGLAYSVDVDGAVVNADRMHWAMAEAIGATVYLARLTDVDDDYEHWYRTFWDFIAVHVIDRSGGSWWHQLDAGGSPAFSTWSGKPDLYHAYQATLYARADPRMGLAAAAKAGALQ
jgi:sulfoquinovose isomerase